MVGQARPRRLSRAAVQLPARWLSGSEPAGSASFDLPAHGRVRPELTVTSSVPVRTTSDRDGSPFDTPGTRETPAAWLTCRPGQQASHEEWRCVNRRSAAHHSRRRRDRESCIRDVFNVCCGVLDDGRFRPTVRGHLFSIYDDASSSRPRTFGSITRTQMVTMMMDLFRSGDGASVMHFPG